MADDPREAAARYRQERERREDPELSGEAPAAASPPRPMTETERWAYVETTIAQAIRRGEFDDLPGAGKPLEGLGDHHDPDWWIRRKIQTEQLSGLGPPALTLRVENERLRETLDRLRRESEVREHLEDFNRRVIEARRQLQGGPPVVTPTRDVDAEVTAWRERRDAAAAAAAEVEVASRRPAPRRRLFGRRRRA
ncbi:DUF1992 domain-containing protein [Microbacterium horticulturae]|uniref:DUF1992 domain-containing protein n=1 Tax=Microbacterium horticulturae TaxID=3028316 RepID=A0ABY8BZC1_9MICO|nr:DUF1992 domain-containing protein [Microbacterium sp. KACC 23027]WEG09550.1 DUF1992 domain-containing protein [Microbacterium sp. KACC 23027]